MDHTSQRQQPQNKPQPEGLPYAYRVSNLAPFMIEIFQNAKYYFTYAAAFVAGIVVWSVVLVWLICVCGALRCFFTKYPHGREGAEKCLTE